MSDLDGTTPEGPPPQRPRRSLTDRTVSGFAWVFAGTVGQTVLQFVVVAILARLLVPKDFGTVTAAMVVIGFSQIFSQLGVGFAIVQRADLTDTHISTGFTFSIILGCVTGAIIFACAPLFASFFRADELTNVIRVLAISFPLDGITVINRGLLQREMRFRTLSMVELVSYAVGYGCVGIAMAFMGFGVWSLVGATLGQITFRTVQIFFVNRHRISFRMDLRALKQLVDYGLGLSIARIGNYLALQADDIVVGRSMGPTALGIYGRAYNLVVRPAALFGTVVDQVLFPAMAEVQNDPKRLGKAFILSSAAIAMVTLPLSAYLIVGAPEIIAILLGPQWTDVVAPFQVLASGLLFRTSYKMSDSLTRAVGLVYRRAWRQWVFLILMFAGAWVGQFFGLVGVAVGVFVAITLNFLVMLQLSSRVIEMDWTDFCLTHLRHLGVALLVGAVSYAAAWATREAGLHDLLVLIATTAAGGAVPGALMLFRPGTFGAEGTWAWSLVQSRLTRKKRKPSKPDR